MTDDATNETFAQRYIEAGARNELPGGMKGLTARENADLCRENGYHVCSPAQWTMDLTVEHVEHCHSIGVQVHTWTVNEQHDVDRIVATGLDGIASDYPERVYTALGIDL